MTWMVSPEITAMNPGRQSIGGLVRLQGRKRERIGEYFLFQFISVG